MCESTLTLTGGKSGKETEVEIVTTTGPTTTANTGPTTTTTKRNGTGNATSKDY